MSTKYRLFETNEYLKSLKKLSKTDREFIANKSTSYIYPQLKDEPHFGSNVKKLKGYIPETWRCRLGKFRLFYTIDETDHIINIVAVEFRRDAYK